MNHKFYITEVFTERPYGGNQLATLPDAADIPTAEMQQIARAFNFPETTFVTGGDHESGFDVRIFTPAAELPFAGHPTLGTSFLLRNHISPGDVDSIVLNLGVGQIPVTFSEDGVLWMSQKQPVFGGSLDENDVAAELGLAAGDIDSRFPCQYVSTGLEFLIVPLNSYDALKKAIPPSTSSLSRTWFLFCPGAYDQGQSIQARMFATELGVSEDPATGSANGCLAAYLAEHAYFGSSDVDARVGQGYEINRPSQLYLRSSKAGDEFEIKVGGKVSLVAEGQWLL